MKSRKTALITGATGGIGYELCKEFARHGFNLVITSKSPKPLDELALNLRNGYGVKVMAVALDLTSDGAPDNLYKAVKQADLIIDVLVNNAGFGLGGYFYTNSPVRQKEMIRVVVSVPTRLCRLFIPDMLRRGYGRILNMASLGSFVPGPMNAVYCAGKAYVLSLSEALAEELHDKGVFVTAACPGGTKSRFASASNMESSLLFNYFVLNPKMVAHEAFRALMAGERVRIIGNFAKASVYLSKFAPRCLVAKFSKAFQRPARKNRYALRGRLGSRILR